MRKKIYYVLKGILRDELLSPSIAEKLSTKLIFAIKALGEMPMR